MERSHHNEIDHSRIDSHECGRLCNTERNERHAQHTQDQIRMVAIQRESEYKRLKRKLSQTQPLFKPLPRWLELILTTLPPLLLLSLIVVSEVGRMMLTLLW